MKKVPLLLIAFTLLLSTGLLAKDMAINPSASVYFSKTDDCTKALVDQINLAKSSVYFCVYSFTEAKVADALIAAKNRKVIVSGVTEEENGTGKGCQFGHLTGAGIDIRWDGNSALMHNKFIVIDQKVVCTGSFNWTSNANKANDENFIVLSGADLCAAYYADYLRVYAQAKK